MATHSRILAWRTPWTEESIVHGVAKSQTRLKQLSTHAYTWSFNDWRTWVRNLISWSLSFPPGVNKMGKQYVLHRLIVSSR